jgi:hypothetical protein
VLLNPAARELIVDRVRIMQVTVARLRRATGAADNHGTIPNREPTPLNPARKCCGRIGAMILRRNLDAICGATSDDRGLTI